MATKLIHRVPAANRYKTFLQLTSALYGMNLSEREIEVMDAIFWAGGKLDAESRERVAKALGITEFNLNNYIWKLKKEAKVFQIDKTTKRPTGIRDDLMINIKPDVREFPITFLLQS
jgi:hypothetical protein